MHTAELRPEPEAPPSGATPRSAMHKINFEAPDYLSTELKIDAVRKQTSVRHVIKVALKEAGFTIKDFDMIEDGRRLPRMMVAVGTRISPRPPHRSRRALLTHRAPPSGFGVETVTGQWV